MSPQNTSYSKPNAPRSFASINPRSLLAFVEPPKHLTLYPPLPPVHARGMRTLKSLDASRDEWEVTTHVLPAAYPRGTPLVRLPSPYVKSTEPLMKEARSKEIEQTASDLIDLKRNSVRGEDCGGSTEEESRMLWTVVNRYVKLRKSRNNRGGTKEITLLLTHPTGFPKEIWEPFTQHLTQALQSSDVSIAEIWSLEAVQHGDAALLNDGRLGDLYDWADNSRDILNFLLHYLPDGRDPRLWSSQPFASRCPAHLPRLPDEIASKRRIAGFEDRTLVAIGHSFGGCTVALAALTQPSLFSSLILVDPVITAPWMDRTAHLKTMVWGAIRRRADWDSREEVRTLFAANPFFAAWDPKVLDTYVEYGVVQDAENGKFVLKTPARQEGACFAEERVGCEVFELLPTLDPRIELRWIVAGKDLYSSVTGDTSEMVWRRPVNASNIRISSSGHLIAQEAPAELACDVHEFLTRKYKDANGKARL